MMAKKTKILIFCLVILLGAVVVAYGAFFHSTNASSQQEDDSVKLAELEAALVKAALAGGVNRDCSDKIKQTHTGKAPKARPT